MAILLSNKEQGGHTVITMCILQKWFQDSEAQRGFFKTVFAYLLQDIEKQNYAL